MNALPTPLALELAAALCIGASGVPGCLLRGSRAAGQGAATALCALGSAIGLAGLALYGRVGPGEAQTAWLGTLPVGRVGFALDGLSALFLVPILLVSALGSLYGASYWTAESRPAGCASSGGS